MLWTQIDLIRQETEQLRSRISYLRESWDDRVSAHVEHTYLDALMSECNTFYSMAYTNVNILREKEQLLQRIADKY